MKITIGNASSATRGAPGRGDQGQKSTPDTNGEVRMVVYTNDTSFIRNYGGWFVTRPKSTAVASVIASKMITACNNPHIGYVYGGKDMWCTGGSDTVSTSKDCGTDCSALVCECVSEALGYKMYSTSASLHTILANLDGGGVFYPPFYFKSWSETPVYNGDVISHPGHALMVVAGNPRAGASDEDPGTEMINNTELGSATRVYSDDTYGYLQAPINYNFVPRPYKPKPSDEYYSFFLQDYGGGPNGSYAWGRFSEICKSECSLSKGLPRQWYAHKEDGYKRGVSPSIGAAMCFTHRTNMSSPGFVCIVEVVHTDYLIVSFVDFSAQFQYVKYPRKYDGNWNRAADCIREGTDYIFQGFIYCPYVSDETVEKSALQRFLSKALSCEGKGASFTKKFTGVDTEVCAWSATFVTACARKASGILNIALPETNSCSDFGYIGVEKRFGVWFDGPALGTGGRPQPEIGDIAMFRIYNKKTRFDKYNCDMIGIVIDVYTNDQEVAAKGTGAGNTKYKFDVLIGDMGGQVVRRPYYTTSGTLSGVFRPHWERVDETAEITKWATSTIGMYNEGTTLEDAAVRDICFAQYSGSRFKPSISESNYVLAAMNYTGMLSNMYSVLAEVRASMDEDDKLVPCLWDYTALSQYRIDIYATEPFPLYSGMTDQIAKAAASTPKKKIEDRLENSSASKSDSTEKWRWDATGEYVQTDIGNMYLNGASQTLFSTLYSVMPNMAAVIGIMANMWQESNWNPGAVNNNGGASGLIQWYGHRSDNMKYDVGADWATNISGQVRYLAEEAGTNSQYREGWQKLREVPNTVEGAEEATRIFLRYFEIGRKQWDTEYETRNATKRVPYAGAAWELFIGGTVR